MLIGLQIRNLHRLSIQFAVHVQRHAPPIKGGHYMEPLSNRQLFATNRVASWRASLLLERVRVMDGVNSKLRVLSHTMGSIGHDDQTITNPQKIGVITQSLIGPQTAEKILPLWV